MQRVAQAAARALCEHTGALGRAVCRQRATQSGRNIIVAGVSVNPFVFDTGPSVTWAYNEDDEDLTSKPVVVKGLTRYFPGDDGPFVASQYMVEVTPTTIAVFAVDQRARQERRHFPWSPKMFPKRIVKPTRYSRLFVGSNFSHEYDFIKSSKGNAILAEIGRATYLLVSQTVSIVRTRGEPVERFVTVYDDDDTDSALPVAHTAKYMYWPKGRVDDVSDENVNGQLENYPASLGGALVCCASSRS